MKDFFLKYLDQLATGLIALVIGWLAKSKSQKKIDDATLTTKIQGIYDGLVEDTKASVEEMKKELKEVKEAQKTSDENWRRKLQEIETNWQKKLKEVEAKWQGKYSRLQSKYNDLLKKYKALKAQGEKK